MPVFIDSFTERECVVEYKGRRYHFEFLTACGWCAALPDGNGSPRRDHPRGAWAELGKLLGQKQEPDNGEPITEEWVKKNDPKYAHTWEWDEHPDEYDEWCWCASCRSYNDGLDT